MVALTVEEKDAQPYAEGARSPSDTPSDVPADIWRAQSQSSDPSPRTDIYSIMHDIAEGECIFVEIFFCHLVVAEYGRLTPIPSILDITTAENAHIRGAILRNSKRYCAGGKEIVFGVVVVEVV